MAEKKEEPSYWAVIPANVRYDKSLSPNAKLLYGELTALCKREGYAWASNKYFANLYQVDRSSISHWIKKLQERGYIKLQFIYADDKRFIEERRIYLVKQQPVDAEKDTTDLPEKNSLPDRGEQQDISTGDNAICGGGEISHNGGGGEIFHHGTFKEPSESIIPLFEKEEQQDISTGDNAIYGGGEISHHGVVKKLHGGGEISPKRIIQANNTSSSSSSSDPPEIDLIRDLKEQLKKLNPSFVFDMSFYPKAVDYMASNDLDSGFVSWMYEFCVNRKPDRIDGFFYKVFFDPRLIEQYKNFFEVKEQPPPVKTLRCPVCGFEHEASALSCPQCHLSKDYLHDSEAVERRKWLYSMPAEIRKAYEQEYDKLLDETTFNDLVAGKGKLDALERKYWHR